MGRFWGLPGTNVVVEYVISMIMEEKNLMMLLTNYLASFIVTKCCELQYKK